MLSNESNYHCCYNIPVFLKSGTGDFKHRNQKRTFFCVGQYSKRSNLVRQSHRKLIMFFRMEKSVSDAVTEHYTDYPYPAYSRGERDGDRDYYLHHTECHHGVCRVIARNDTQPRFYHHTLPLDVLNMYLFKVSNKYLSRIMSSSYFPPSYFILIFNACISRNI